MVKALVDKLKYSKVIKSGFWYLIGTLFLKGISFLTMPIFTSLLNDKEYGILNVYGTMLAVVTVLISLGLYASVSRAKFDFKEDYNQYLSSTLFLGTVIFVIIGCLGIVFRTQLGKLMNLDSVLVILLIVQGFFSFVFEFCCAKYTVEYKYKEFLFVSITSTVLNIIISIVMIKMLSYNRHYGRIIAGAIVTVIYGLILYAVFMIKGKTFLKKKYWKYALKISIPYIPHMLSGIILTMFDTVMISKFIGNGEAGIYSFAYKVGMMLNVIQTAGNKAWVPWFLEKMDQKKYEDIQIKSKYYIGLFSLITFILIYISPEVGKILGRNEVFWTSLSYVPIIMIGYYFIFLYSVLSNLEFFFKKIHFISFGSILAAGINIILNYLLIPRYGYGMAAWTTLISYMILFIYHYIVVFKILNRKVFEMKYFVYSIFFIAISGMLFFILKENWIIRYVMVILMLIITCYNGKKYLILK